VFDSSGNFDSTNPLLAGAGPQFFRLLIGATNQPATNPPVGTAPSITNQPQSFTVAVGANVSFSVGASGTAPLNYFWSFNTNTPAGGNSNTLSLVNVTTNDAGSYRVVVSNSVGAATSSVATLAVQIPPSIAVQPTNFSVTAGGSATFSVTAAGSATLRYQWFFNTNTAIANATNATLTLNPANATNAGTYSVVVTNSVGSATSSVATLTVFSPPVITVQPQSQSVTVSNDVTFSVNAAGTAPLAYRWFFNTNTLVGGNSNSYSRINVQTTNAGTYSVIITNSYGAVTSSFATLTVSTAAVNFAQFNLAGFAWTTTGGGVLAENNAAYRKVTNALDMANAINSGTVKVIEITTNLDLGWLEIGAAAQAVGPFRAHATPSLHPRLIQTGVSLLDIQGEDGLTIFSANGATIRHCCFNIKNSRNVIVRNLKFDEMWEWDEGTKGNYDSKDWDFIDLGNGGGVGTTTNIWIDHCTFTKTYDGIVDIKGGANHITLSWNRYVGDDGATNPNSFVWQQINTLESNKTAYAMYNSLRTASGLTPTEIVTIIQGQDKTHLAGANDGVANAGNAAENALISITFHHQWFQNCWDRCVPRLRAGNVHNFNIYADTSLALDAKRLRDAHTINSSYNFNPPLNGSISTESGAILVENSVYQDCLTPLRNNQTDPTNPAYTGKIMALNSIYSFRTTGGTTDYYQGSSTNAPGDTYFGPVQAAVIPFAWNLPGNVLPYTYTNVLADPTQLKSILTNSTYGCGAGVLTWAKTNWLKTSY
jgi:pectate lyase